MKRGAGGSGRRGDAVYPNGITTNYTYDTLNRLLRLKADLGATPVTDFQYVYDNAGNRTRKQQLDYTEDYTYDPLYRLSGATRSAGGTGLWQWAYDAVGNRTSAQLDNTVATSTYNEKNQLVSSTGGGTLRWRGTLNEPGSVAFTSALVNGKPAKMLAGNVFEAMLDMVSGNNTVTVQATDVSGNVTTKNYQVSVSGNGATYTYDANGNLTQKVEGADTWGYEWNPENQLTRVTKSSVEQARFKYDPLGRRVEKVAAGATTTWAYDVEDIVRQIRGPEGIDYVHGPEIDEPLATDDGATPTFLHADALGSVTASTSPSGAGSATRRYDAWGILEAGGSVGGHAFTGREWDPEAGFYYYRARYYDARQGRFVGQDPLLSENSYWYADAFPTLGRDPSGLSTIVVNRRRASITVYDSNGMPIRTYPAGNFTVNPSGNPNQVGCKCPAPSGTWVVQEPIVFTTARPEYGKAFFPVGAMDAKRRPLDIARRRGIGIHAGRRGPKSKTEGCIRVSEDTLDDLLTINTWDPIERIVIP